MSTGAYPLGTGVVITELVTVLGVPQNPTTSTFRVRAPDNSIASYVFGVAPEVTNPAVGTFVLSLTPAEVPVAGPYHYDFEGTGAVVVTSEGDFQMIASSTNEVAPPKPVAGPCQSWCDASDVAVYAGDPGSIDLTKYAIEASALLFELSARQFSGTCVRKVRPCGSPGCLGWGYWTSAIGARFWLGDTLGGWGWGSGGFGDPATVDDFCGCSALDRVNLAGFPVWSITEVKIDGVVVSPTLYRLDRWEWLTAVRVLSTDQPTLWPSCQNLDLDDTQPGTFSVSYLCGADPPLLGKDAAASLAAQFYFAAVGAACQLPVGTTKLVRQGVTIERALFAQWARKDGQWATGLPLVDAFLAAYNPAGLRRRPAVWTPDVQPYAPKLGAIPGGS